MKIKQSMTETVILESDIDDMFKSIYTAIITNIQKSFGNSSDWITGSVIDIILEFQNIFF